MFSGYEREEVRFGDLVRFAKACDHPLALLSRGTFTTTSGYLNPHLVKLFVRIGDPRNSATRDSRLATGRISLSFMYRLA